MENRTPIKVENRTPINISAEKMGILFFWVVQKAGVIYGPPRIARKSCHNGF